MSRIVDISDISMPGLDVFFRLTEAELRNRLEPEKGIFIAESQKVIELALDAGCEPVSFLMERKKIAGQAQRIISRCPDVPVYTGDSGLLAELTGYRLSRGIICAMRRPRLPSVEEACAGARRIAVLEGITDSTNVGAIFRSAATLGIDAALVTPSCCDPLCRRAARVSMGAIFKIPWTRIGSGASEWPKPGLERLKALGFRTVAMVSGNAAVSIDDTRLMAEKKLAIILGTEGNGLSPGTVAACDYTAHIPMFHGMDSMNVAAASVVAFWQLKVW